ncbi:MULTISPECIES: alpha/beta fold hydrolase [unclassified Methylobacterium]|uniref:alpha/beta hydrolase n=1 Tax=unclassified Methylobacterium TaxID=2615210 RepID=UPI000362ECA0|nr:MULTISPECIES: alpha/beta fold hydrolase [unclassified Methylobacterium]
MSLDSLAHRWYASEGSRSPLLLLHGTGGDEDELVPFAQAAAPGAPMLAVRGAVSEGGKLRHFARHPDGRFDSSEVVRRADELAAFVAAARDRYGFGPPLALGFSNGANIAAALMLLHPALLRGAILLRAVPPLTGTAAAALVGQRAVVVSGETDTIAPPALGADLALCLTELGAEATHHVLPCGHDLTPADVPLARDWLSSLAEGAPAGPASSHLIRP